MGTLYLIGLGLWDEKDATLRARSVVGTCDAVFVEEYTSRLFGAEPGAIAGALGREPRSLTREEVEDGTVLMEAAKSGVCALLTGGDPAFATTHAELAIRAREEGIDVRWVHAPTIFAAAAALTGLSPYKFGRSTTLVRARGDYLPASPLEFAARNMEGGLHTLILLDIDTDSEPPAYMLIPEALDVMERIEGEGGPGVIGPGTLLCGIARAGSPSPVVRCGTPADLRAVDWGGPLHAMVLPGDLHFMEAKGLVVLAGAPARIAEE